jgi:5-methylcytosine-specific restriction protein B
MMPDYRDSWDLAGRDVVPDLTASGRPSDVGSALLYAMLVSHNAEWSPPYQSVRRALSIRSKPIEPEREEQADSRIRTWMVYFRALGLLYDDGGTLKVTELGNRVRELLDGLYGATDDFAKEVSRASRWKLARLVAPSLARYQLHNPLTKDLYPPDTDIHPLWAIWRAMRALDNKLHWDELDRALTPCLRMEHLDGAIETIRNARTERDYDPNDPAILDRRLGPRKPDTGRTDEDQQDRVIPWLSRAGFKDLFLEPRGRPDGYRYLQAEMLPVLDEMLETPPEHNSTDDAADYLRWLGDAVPDSLAPSPFESSELLNRIVSRCRKFGSRKIIALVGPAGTGKTFFAREAAAVLADSDPSRIKVMQFHAAATYEQFMGGLSPLPGGGFAPLPGEFLLFNELARNNPGVHVLVIEELSRADVANVLGELLTYVEYRDVPFTVSALGEEIRIASNLVIIGTMNPADRSVLNMDDAMIRRLRQIPVPPNPHALSAILDSNGMDATLRDEVVRWFEGLPADAPFGHGLFVGVASERDLHDLWHEELQYFLRRGGIATYHDPELIQRGYRWRREEYERSGPSGSSNDAPEPNTDVATAAPPGGDDASFALET